MAHWMKKLLLGCLIVFASFGALMIPACEKESDVEQVTEQARQTAEEAQDTAEEAQDTAEEAAQQTEEAVEQ